MDLTIQTETFGVKDLTWLAHAKNLSKFPATMATAHLVAATHYPDGFVKPGTVVGLFTGGASAGLWTPWLEDGGAGENGAGEEVIAGIVFSGFQVRQTEGSTAPVAARTVGSILLPQSDHRVIVGNLPAGLLADGSTANTATAAQLETAGFTTMDLGV